VRSPGIGGELSDDSNLRYSDDGDIWLFEVQGKNTKGGSKTTRDAWMPDDVAEDMHKYSRERGLSLSDQWIDASTPSVRRWVKEAAHAVAEQTDDPRWQSVSSHDLRRSWATYHLVERQVDVRTMMSVGGWSDYSAIEPYLAEPTEARIGEPCGHRGRTRRAAIQHVVIGPVHRQSFLYCFLIGIVCLIGKSRSR